MNSVSLIDGHIDGMTDNEIIKALECCINSKFGCDEKCLFFDKDYGLAGCLQKFLDLINRQKAEIDILIRKKETLQDEVAELQAKNERLTEKVEALGDPIESAQYELFELREENRELHKICNQAIKTYKETKAEAIKEFAERLKDKTSYAKDVFDYTEKLVVNVEEIDNLVKEMVGDTDAR